MVWGAVCVTLGARALVRAPSFLSNLPPSLVGIAVGAVVLIVLFALAGFFCIAAGYRAFRWPASPPTRSLSAVIAFIFLVLASRATHGLLPGPDPAQGSDWEHARAFMVNLLILLVSVLLYAIVKKWLREASYRAAETHNRAART